MLAAFDHLVLTTANLDACIHFYTDVLGMTLERFVTGGGERLALKFGDQKINLHERGKEFEPKAHTALPGTLDVCFLAAIPLDDCIARLRAANVPIEVGPVAKTGSRFPLRSVYVRDPDQNLIEISERATG